LPIDEVAGVGKRISGKVVEIDSFGNLVTNIPRESLAGVPTDETVCITCDEHQTQGIFQNYADQPEMTLIAVFGKNDNLELAIVGDSAAAMLGVSVNAPVTIEW
jgi:S-adenosylmethionine hydrolase